MERRPHDPPFGHDGTNDDMRAGNNFGSSLPHSNSPPTGNVQFCDGLIHGLPGLNNMPPITAAGASSSMYGAPWNSGSAQADAGLTQFPSSFGGWTSYPTDDSAGSQFPPDPISPPAAATSLGFLSSDDFFMSLSQPDSTSSTENAFYNPTRVRSHSEHFDALGGLGGVEFTNLTKSGRDLYAESLEQWAQKPKVPEPNTYDPFGTTSLLHQQPSEIVPPSIPTPSYSVPVVEKPKSPAPSVISPPSMKEACDPPVKNKPSYSDVARNKPTKKEPRTTSNNVSQDGLASQPKPEGFPDFTGVKHKSYNRPRTTSKSYSKPKKRQNVDVPNIKPDSRYGLDTFDSPVLAKACLSDHLSVSSGSTPHSRKGSTCSETGSYCGIEDLDTIDALKRSCSADEPAKSCDNNKAAHPWTELKFDGPKTSNVNEAQKGSKASNDRSYLVQNKPNRSSSLTSDEGKRKTDTERVDGLESKRARGSESTPTANKHNKPGSAKQPVFFDPKRIFGGAETPTKGKTNPGKSSANKSQSGAGDDSYPCIPNNQQPQASASLNHSQRQTSGKSKPSASQTENILNNDKPKTKQSSNINRSCYINNNLRDSSKKQTNADAQRDSETNASATTGESGTSTTPNTSTSHQQRGNQQPKQRAATFRGGSRSTSRGSGPGRPNHNSSQKGKGSAPSRPDTSRGQSTSSHTDSHMDDATQTSDTGQVFPPRRRFGEKKNSSKETWDQQYMIGDLIIQLWKYAAWASQELGYVVWNITKLTISIGLALLLMLGQHSLSAFKSCWVVIEARFFTSTKNKGSTEDATKKARAVIGLKDNITLPATGDEAMKRLLAGKGKDPYSILGVKIDASDDVIKKYYRKQAVLVHPDKNQTPGAEEAFKILGHAFDLIGEPEKRRLYDSQRLEAQEEEEAMHQFADLLSKLNERMQEAANLMRCENCGGKHRRVPSDRPMYAARYCQRCDYCHPVREGDVWAESHMLGFLWNYYACMDNRVYDITEWASCQSDRLKHIQANAHQIVYRIATNTNTNRHARTNNNRSNESDIEDLLNHLFHHGGPPGASPAQPGATDPASETFGQYGRPGATSGGSWGQSAPGGAKKGGRRKKKRH